MQATNQVKPNQQALYNLFAAYLHTVPLEELIDSVERARRGAQLRHIVLYGATCSFCLSRAKLLDGSYLRTFALELKEQLALTFAAIVTSILTQPNRRLNAPELDFKASEGTIEEDLESENYVTETEITLTKGKCQPSQAELAEVFHDILTEFKHAAVVAKLKVDYSPLQEAVSARVRKDRPEWSEYDLEAAYNLFYEKDAEINALIVSVCESSPKVITRRSLQYCSRKSHKPTLTVYPSDTNQRIYRQILELFSINMCLTPYFSTL